MHISFEPAFQFLDIYFTHVQNDWRRKWQLTPVFLPGESLGQRSLLLSLFIPPTWKTGTITMHQVRHHPCHQGSHILVSWLIGNFTRWWPTNKVRYPVLHFSARHPTEVIALALVVKNLPTNAGDTRDAGLIPWSGRSPGGGNCNPLQYCCLENPKDRGAWRATVHGVTKSQT